MAARAQRRTAPRSRRRAAGPPPRGARRPAAAPAASTGTGSAAIALTLVLAAVLYSYLNPAIDFVKTYTATTAAKAELHELQHENKRLHWRVQYADDPIVLDGKARAQGMVAEGETPVVVRGLERLARPRSARWLAPAPTSSAPLQLAAGRRSRSVQRRPAAAAADAGLGRAPRPASSRRSSRSPC